MAITPLPFLDRTLPTFKADTDKFFGQQLPQFSVDINALANGVDADAADALASKNAAKTSETNAASSASAANTSKNAASTSAGQAATSATTASDKATAANTSAGQAANSATAAGTSATNANTSAGQASTSATNAKTSETNSKTSETNAASSASAAATSKTGADSAKTAAETAASTATSKATAASDSAAAALASKNAAATSATNAADSASSALSSKNSASNSATNAADSAAAAAASAQTAAAGGVKTVNGRSPNTQGAVVLVASDLSLGNVNNTADSAKPVSTAQQAALDLKASKAGDTFTGEMKFTNLNSIRMINQTGEYGAFWRGDATALYLLLTNKNEASGAFNAFRPITVDLATGLASISGSSEIAGKLRTPRKVGGALFDGTQDVGVNSQWIGNVAANMPTGTAAYSATDAALLVDGIYAGLAKGYPIDFGNRMQIRGAGLAVTEIYHEWQSGKTGLYVRSRGDVNTLSWTPVEQVAFVSALPAAVRAAALTGMVKSNNPVVATDSVLNAIGKLQGQLDVGEEDFDSRLLWQFPGNRENWVVTGGALSFPRKGLMTLTPSVGDSYITSPNLLRLAGNTYGRVRVKVTRMGGSGWDGTLYYVTSGHGVAQAYSKAIPDPQISVGQTAVLDFDMWNLSAGGDDWYNSVINQLRLDLGSTVDDVFDIDYIAVGRLGPSQQQILGPVNVGEGGVLTGAVIESGSSGNGEYVKFADGTMICWVSKIVSLAYGSTFGSSWYGTNAWSYPAGFVSGSIPSVNAQAIAAGTIILTGLLAAAAGSSTFYFINNANETKSTTILFTAVGRWK